MNRVESVTDDKTNGAAFDIETGLPYAVEFELTGTSDLLFHRWNAESIDEKAKLAKNSKGKKTDNIESYVWRDENGNLALPAEYIRGAIIAAAKYKQDPRSPRKSAMDLFKAGVVGLSPLASLGQKVWDYEDRRRVMVQRQGINRTRPAMRAGWKAKFTFQVLSPEYISPDLLQEVLTNAGRLVGIADFRPTYGRFSVTSFKVIVYD
jgi:hypothetical protein